MINSRNSAIVLLSAVVLQSSSSFSVDAYTLQTTTSTPSTAFRRSRFVTSSVLASSSTSTSTDFSTFADSLESNLDDVETNTSTSTSSAKAAASSTTPTTLTMEKPWQAKLDDLLDPMTNLADRQILLSELLTSNEKIRDDVLDALTNRKIDPLLTPTQKKLQAGTRAVVRQLANDILPQISQSAEKASSSSSNTPSLPFFPPAAPTPADMQSIGNRLFSVVSNQIQKNFEDLQDDLTDPINKIPARLEKQREALEKQRDGVLQEARNVFLEKPEGLEEPSYKVVAESDLYEIRSYDAYSMASTAMQSKTDDNAALEGMAAGSAFNTLASYIFGANDENKVMDMTTPVTTTSAGDMRFYVKTIDGRIPQPEIDSEGTSSSDNIDNEIEIVQIPAALLAIRKFTGFATDGEVARQKDTLLQALEMDCVELDVAHGVIVPHVVFQYNPPYTLPMVRCNEIGVPVRKIGQAGDEDETKTISLKEEWVVDDESDDDDTSPSDVE